MKIPAQAPRGGGLVSLKRRVVLVPGDGGRRSAAKMRRRTRAERWRRFLGVLSISAVEA